MKYTIGLFAAAFALAGACHAGAVFGNLPGTGNYAGTTMPLGPTRWVAVGVQTGNSAMEFDSLSGYFRNPLPSPAVLDGWIYSNSGSNLPGSVVGTFVSQNIPGSTSSSTEFTFLSTAPILLSANTDYWFVMADVVGPAWMTDTAGTNTGTVPAAENSSGWSFVGVQTTINSGTGWSSSSDRPPSKSTARSRRSRPACCCSPGDAWR